MDELLLITAEESVLTRLPCEVASYAIGSYLNARDICRVAQTCRALRCLVQHKEDMLFHFSRHGTGPPKLRELICSGQGVGDHRGDSHQSPPSLWQAVRNNMTVFLHAVHFLVEEYTCIAEREGEPDEDILDSLRHWLIFSMSDALSRVYGGGITSVIRMVACINLEHQIPPSLYQSDIRMTLIGWLWVQNINHIIIEPPGWLFCSELSEEDS